MKIKGIVFDKDGTLLDFDSFWVPVARAATKKILAECGAPHLVDKVLSSLGVLADDTVNIDGMLCKGSYEDMFWVYYNEISEVSPVSDKIALRDSMVKAYHDSLCFGELKPSVENLPGLLDKLRSMGITVGLVTSDDMHGAELCLKSLGIFERFNVILASDRSHPPKPDPYYMNEFLRLTGLERDEVMMVGDTLADMKFAKNSGVFAFGVAKTHDNLNILMPFADRVEKDLWGIFDVIK